MALSRPNVDQHLTDAAKPGRHALCNGSRDHMRVRNRQVWVHVNVKVDPHAAELPAASHSVRIVHTRDTLGDARDHVDVSAGGIAQDRRTPPHQAPAPPGHQTRNAQRHDRVEPGHARPGQHEPPNDGARQEHIHPGVYCFRGDHAAGEDSGAVSQKAPQSCVHNR
jgi:hypothetical protein